jgi:hypothetical protein
VLRLLEGELPIPLRRRLELELEICREMQRDYYTDFDTLLSRIREKYPACTAENLEYIISTGTADYIRKNGVRYFQRAARSNILECRRAYLESLTSGVYDDTYRNELRHENLDIMKKHGYRKVRYRVREWLEVAEHAEREGKTIRVHLPYPAECPEQSDIVLHSSSHPVYISDVDQRTAFIETEYKKGERFEIEFSYTLTVPYYDLDPAKVSPEQPDFCTEEELPQIRLTPFIRSLADKAEKAVNGLKVNVYKIRNDFFGEHITVAGLLTGKDLIAQLKGKELGDKLLLPSVMFRADENITLDDMTQLDIENALGIKTEISESTGDAFFDALTNI